MGVGFALMTEQAVWLVSRAGGGMRVCVGLSVGDTVTSMIPGSQEELGSSR